MTERDDVAPALAAALEKRGYDTLTPVQEAMLDAGLAGRDAIVSAQTGSGKTVAFGLALAPTLLDGAERLGHAAAPLALIVAPTRELALQVNRELAWLYAEAGATLATCVGGMDPRAERRALQRGAHIVVGTPGRLRDQIARGALDMTGLRAVVLDEADEMLDLGFREDLEFILEAAPAERRTLLFSATIAKGVARLAERYQRDAARIATAAERTPHADIEHRVLAVAPSDRETAIFNLLRLHDAERALVFCTTRAAAAHLAARLGNRGFAVVALSGELSQSERTHALQALRSGRARVCVATDVAARGIDLPGLDLVIHADLPTSPETLLHRSGRTGRAGRKGLSVLVAPHRMRRRAEGLLAAAGIEPVWAAPPTPAEILSRDEARMLSDESLAAEVADEERALVAALLDRYGAERVAAAFLRRLREGLAAPEELSEIVEAKPPRAPRPEFGPSIWFTLSVGRKQRAEPRWLLPLVCNAGGLDRRDVGAIRIEPDVSHVEIAAARADAFLAALGPDRTLEGGVTVAPAAAPPEARQERAPSAPRRKPAGAKPRRAGSEPGRASKPKRGPR